MSSLITVLFFLLFLNVGGEDYYCRDLGRRIPFSQSCNGRPNGKCYFYNLQIVCPTNPNNCFHKGNSCDGRINPICDESYCSGKIEDYPLYNVATGRCDSRDFCGKRPGAAFHNNQCFRKSSSASLQYLCLNRMDISENVIRQTSIYKPQVKIRLNLFALFKSNDTHVICGNNSFEKKCEPRVRRSAEKTTISCKGHEITKDDVCANDFMKANNYPDVYTPPPSIRSDCDLHDRFFCTKSRQCIYKHQICDGSKDCEDEGEDEELEECKKRNIFPSEATLECDEIGRPEKYQVHINHNVKYPLI